MMKARQAINDELHQSTAASTWWCGPWPCLGWVEMAVGFPEGPSYPGHSPFIFSLCCPLNDRRRAAHSIFKIGRLFSLSLLSCPTLALLCLLILLLLLMSGNVYPNPGPIFPCSGANTCVVQFPNWCPDPGPPTDRIYPLCPKKSTDHF